MSVEQPSRRDRLSDLLVDKSLFGLSAAEEHELELLRRQFPDVAEDEFEITAAAIQCAYVAEQEEQNNNLPPSLRSMIEDTARAPGMFDGVLRDSTRSGSSQDRFGSAERQVSMPISKESPTPRTELAARQPQERTREVIAWLFAAAAMIIALLGWVDQFERPKVIRPQTRSLAEQRQDLIGSEGDTRVIPWIVNDAKWITASEDAVIGDVAWSDQAQRGFMSFKGLAANEDSDTVYQLWIFDKTRDERYPVDGGTFQVSSSDSETIIPIDAKLAVNESVQFAITVEDDPGVVVSDRKRLPLVAVVDPQQ